MKRLRSEVSEVSLTHSCWPLAPSAHPTPACRVCRRRVQGPGCWLGATTGTNKHPTTGWAGRSMNPIPPSPPSPSPSPPSPSPSPSPPRPHPPPPSPPPPPPPSPPLPPSPPGVYNVDDSQGLGLRWEGVGAISGGGATTKLLMDYEPGVVSDILDYLFLPSFGLNLQILKVEIGGTAVVLVCVKE